MSFRRITVRENAANLFALTPGHSTPRPFRACRDAAIFHFPDTRAPTSPACLRNRFRAQRSASVGRQWLTHHGPRSVEKPPRHLACDGEARRLRQSTRNGHRQLQHPQGKVRSVDASDPSSRESNRAAPAPAQFDLVQFLLGEFVYLPVARLPLGGPLPVRCKTAVM